MQDSDSDRGIFGITFKVYSCSFFCKGWERGDAFLNILMELSQGQTNDSKMKQCGILDWILKQKKNISGENWRNLYNVYSLTNSILLMLIS